MIVYNGYIFILYSMVKNGLSDKIQCIVIQEDLDSKRFSTTRGEKTCNCTQQILSLEKTLKPSEW